jgi:hypothetical protein
MCPLSREEMMNMPVLKNKTQGNYVNVYKGIAIDQSLSLKDRGMLLTLLSLPDNWDFTVNGLRKILPDGKAAIYSCLDSLQGAGYLTKEQSRVEVTEVFLEEILLRYMRHHSHRYPIFGKRIIRQRKNRCWETEHN